MNVYMVYNPEEQGYLFTEKMWAWLPQEESLVSPDLDWAENIIKEALETRGWKLEIHTFKLERIT